MFPGANHHGSLTRAHTHHAEAAGDALPQFRSRRGTAEPGHLQYTIPSRVITVVHVRNWTWWQVLLKFHGPLNRGKAPPEAVIRWADEQFVQTRMKAEQMLVRAKLAGHTGFS